MGAPSKADLGTRGQHRSKESKMFRHVLCVYPYRRELNDVGFFPPLGLEFIAAVIEPYAETLEIIDLRKDPGHSKDFIRPETDLVCFSINWDAKTVLKDKPLNIGNLPRMPMAMISFASVFHALVVVIVRFVLDALALKRNRAV